MDQWSIDTTYGSFDNNYIWPQWFLFAQYSSSQSSGAITVLLGCFSSYSYMILWLQRVDFPAIPTEAIILVG